MLACPQLLNPFIGIVYIGHSGSGGKRDRRWVSVNMEQKFERKRASDVAVTERVRLGEDEMMESWENFYRRIEQRAKPLLSTYTQLSLLGWRLPHLRTVYYAASNHCGLPTLLMCWELGSSRI